MISEGNTNKEALRVKAFNMHYFTFTAKALARFSQRTVLSQYLSGYIFTQFQKEEKKKPSNNFKSVLSYYLYNRIFQINVVGSFTKGLFSHINQQKEWEIGLIFPGSKMYYGFKCDGLSSTEWRLMEVKFNSCSIGSSGKPKRLHTIWALKMTPK